MGKEFSEFDRELDRRGTHSVKWDWREKIFGRDDVLPFWVADMDVQVPEEILRPMRERVRHGVMGYTFRPDTYEAAVVQWLSRRHGWETEQEWMRYVPGVMSGIAMAIQAFSEPGDKVVVQPPVYFPFFDVVKANERRLGYNELVRTEEGYTIDFEDLEQQLAEDRTRLFLLCSPHNPVGRVWTQKELERIGHLCSEHDVLIVSDEIHYDIFYGKHEHIPIASLASEFLEQTITLISAGKSFNIQGMGSGTVIIPSDPLREAYDKAMKRNWAFHETVMSVVACEAAYRHGYDWLNELVAYLQHNRNFLMDYVQERLPGISVLEPEGTYLAWLDCRETGMSPKELRQFMIDEARVGLNDGRQFGPGGEGFQRFNFACPRKTLREGLERIERALKERS